VKAVRAAGLTLMELLIALVLVGILLGAVGMVYDVSMRAFTSQWKRSGIKGEVGRALGTIGHDLRQADSLLSAQATSLSFAADTDNDGIEETIRVSWSGAPGAPLDKAFLSGAPTATVPLVAAVQSAAFAYYDADNNLLSFPVSLAQVKSVSSDLIAVDGEEVFHLRSRATLRIT
jgi:prepilin-type N-terminal cleavage/methylation domain-containing protein